MKLKEYPEVMKLVPEYCKCHVDYKNCVRHESENDTIDSLTPLLSLEVGIDSEKLAKIINWVLIDWYGEGLNDAREMADAIIASSNVIEIKRPQ